MTLLLFIRLCDNKISRGPISATAQFCPTFGLFGSITWQTLYKCFHFMSFEPSWARLHCTLLLFIYLKLIYWWRDAFIVTTTTTTTKHLCNKNYWCIHGRKSCSCLKWNIQQIGIVKSQYERKRSNNKIAWHAKLIKKTILFEWC